MDAQRGVNPGWSAVGVRGHRPREEFLLDSDRCHYVEGQTLGPGAPIIDTPPPLSTSELSTEGTYSVTFAV